jgi:hypothetical protein
MRCALLAVLAVLSSLSILAALSIFGRYVSPEERAKKKAADFTNVANLTPRTSAGFNLRVRVASMEHAANR